ncbi:MAG: glycosyltransferase family 39 protein [Anaerolineales bacterium]|jgi:hypothetical protein
MSRADRIALVLSLLAVVAAFLVADRIFENIAHLEDEIAYLWQAQAIAHGDLTLPSPPHPHSFLVPFVVDYKGLRFGKYPLGWPVLLGVGVRLGVRNLVNPLLAGLGVWLTYRLGKKIFGETVGLLAAGLTLTSPFFLVNSGSLLSHPFGLVLSAAFALAWLDRFGPGSTSPKYLPTVVAGLTLGVLALTRPWTAVAVGLPFAFHGLYLLLRGDWETRRHVLAVGGISLALGALNFLWQYAVTGDFLLNPYTLWWSYDKLGFGSGYGITKSGHTLDIAWINTRFSLYVGYRDLFGWGPYSWIFLPFGLLAIIIKRNWRGLMVGSVIASLVLLYMAYWVGSWLYGPRYFYEGLYSLTLLSAVGIAFLAGWPVGPDAPWKSYSGWRQARPLALVAILGLLVSANLLFYTPLRLKSMYGLYGMERADLQPFLTPSAEKLAPALVIVHPDQWMDYGVLLSLEDPFLDTPFIFAYTQGSKSDADLASDFPGRTTYHYYPDKPYTFFIGPRPGS